MVITESLILYSNLNQPSKILPKSVWASSSLFVIKPLSRDSQKERLGLEIRTGWPMDINPEKTGISYLGVKPLWEYLVRFTLQWGHTENKLGHKETCIMKQQLKFACFGFLPVSENHCCSARFGPFLPDLNFFCPVLFPHVESLAPSHQITQPSAIPAGRGTKKSVLLYKAGGAMNVTTVNIFHVIFVLPTPPASGTGPCQNHLKIPNTEKHFYTPCSNVEQGLKKKNLIH